MHAGVRRVRRTPRSRPFRPLTFAACASRIPLKVAARVRIPLGVLLRRPLVVGVSGLVRQGSPDVISRISRGYREMPEQLGGPRSPTLRHFVLRRDATLWGGATRHGSQVSVVAASIAAGLTVYLHLTGGQRRSRRLDRVAWSSAGELNPSRGGRQPTHPFRRIRRTHPTGGRSSSADGYCSTHGGGRG